MIFEQLLACVIHVLAIAIECPLFAAIAWAALLSSENSTASAGFQEMTRSLTSQELKLLDEYRDYYAKQIACYRNIRMELILRRSWFPELSSAENPQGRETTRLLFRSNGDRLFREDWDNLDWKTENVKGETTIVAVGPSQSFMARGTASGDFTITLAFRDRDEAVHKAFYPEVLGASYSAGWPMERFLFAPFGLFDDWQIEQVTPIEADGQRLIHVVCRGLFDKANKSPRGTPVDSTSTKYKYEFKFLRDAAWALKEFEMGPIDLPAKGETQRGKIEYSGESNGIPLIKHAVFWREAGPELRPYYFEDFEVSQITPGPVPEAEFLPSALNMAMAKSNVNWWSRALVLGFVITLLGSYSWLKHRPSAI